MNIYKNKDGLRVMEVEYGWGMEMEAFEFPVELAEKGVLLFNEAMKNKDKLEGKINEPSLMIMMSYCMDSINNHKNGESTFILKEFYSEVVETMQDLTKKL